MNNIKNKVKLTAFYHRMVGLHHARDTITHTSNVDDLAIKYHGRSVGNDLFDFASVYTGYMSLQCKREVQSDPNFKPVSDHYWPRQWCGEYIARRFLIDEELLSFQDFSNMVYKYSHTHLVTRKENQLLKRFQTADTFSDPWVSYMNAGIILTFDKEKVIPKPWLNTLNES